MYKAKLSHLAMFVCWCTVLLEAAISSRSQAIPTTIFVAAMIKLLCQQ